MESTLRRRRRFHGIKRMVHPSRNLTTMKKLPKTVGLTSLRMERVKSRPRIVIRWLYSVSYFIFLAVLLGLNSVVPIDLIIRSSTTASKLAVHTLIVIVACVIFLVISFVLYISRVLMQRTHLQDITKLYMPTTEKDISPKVSKYIEKEYQRTEWIQQQAAPQGRVMHPGQYHRYDNTGIDLQDGLVYDDILHSIGEDVKYRHILPVSTTQELTAEGDKTLRQILTRRYVATNYKDTVILEEFLSHYERLRFGGKPMTYEQFVRFLQLWSCVRTHISQQHS